jgi:hypothetical protein
VDRQTFKIDEDNDSIFLFDKSSFFYNKFSTLIVEKNQELSFSSPKATWQTYVGETFGNI